jgi:hypothetical protein
VSDVPSFVETVVNKKTGKTFVLLDAVGTRFQVVSPDGKISSLPEALFDEDMQILEGDQISSSLTPPQLDQVLIYNRKADAEALRIEEAKKARLEELSRAQQPDPTPKKRSSSPRKKKNDIRSGLAAEWNSPRMTFYRHQIDPIGPKQSFKINITGTGTFKMTRHEFETVFNEVVMSASYRNDGLFTYDAIPEKASPFKIS